MSEKIPFIRSEFQNLMSYCARDVQATFNVLTKVLPLYYQRLVLELHYQYI